MKLSMQELDRSNQGKDTIFPASKPWSSSQDPQNPKHEMYIKSHGAFAAGEQRNRHYNWSATGVDPSSHTFGKCLCFHSLFATLDSVASDVVGRVALCWHNAQDYAPSNACNYNMCMHDLSHPCKEVE